VEENMSNVRALAACLAAALVAGCATFAVPAYSPDYPSLDRLKVQGLAPVALGTVEPRDPDHPVNRLTLRGAPFAPPGSGFAAYLESALRTDLTELRRLDPNASTRLDATLLKNDFDISGVSTGTGFMRVRLVVTRAGQTRLDKTYEASTSFPSHLAANVAVPRAQAEYPALVRALLRNVYTDPAFQAALQP
jgi:hypothetical protein